ncbi:MAG: butyrate kinase, partial [Sedimentibacter sp.]
EERSLILNLGSTSTKVAVYDSLNEIFKKSIQHSNEELSVFHSIWEQVEFRKGKIIDSLVENGFDLKDFNVIACRGGLVKPIPGGIYEVNEEMLKDMRSEVYGTHPASVGDIIAYELGREYNIPVITADMPVTDEMCNLARFSGMKELPRVSSFHALNQKRTARVIADRLRVSYNKLNLIVVHLGGGISVAAHEKGLVIDVNNALDGEGPFSPERAGTVPAGELIKMCFSGKYTEGEMIKKVKGNGGLMSYLGTNSGLEVEDRIKNGDKYALEVFEAMAYKVCKEIGAEAAALKGKVDAIVLTGSLAYSERLVNWIKDRVSFLAPIYLCPGENEMLSLAENAVRYLKCEVKPLKYN